MAFIAIIISIISLIISWSANHKSNQIASQSLSFQKETEGNNNVSSVYDKIMYWSLRGAWNKINNNTLFIGKDSTLQLFIDELEWLSLLYCDGKIQNKYLVANFKSILTKTCQNNQVISLYWWSKNGLSMLCSIYVWTGGMWQFYNNHPCKTFDNK